MGKYLALLLGFALQKEGVKVYDWSRTCLFALVIVSFCFGIEGVAQPVKFFEFYDKGVEFMEKSDYERALAEFKSATSLEFEDQKQAKTYGTRFIKYYPHLEMARAFLALGEYKSAQYELDLSKSFVKSRESKKLEEELAIALSMGEKKEEKGEVTPQVAANTDKPTYDPNKITQVGARLSIAVSDFKIEGTSDFTSTAITEKVITELVRLRRFKVLEREALQKIIEEQKLGMSGLIDESTAAQVGKLAGADAILTGSVTVTPTFSKISVRLVEVETGETIAVAENQTEGTSLGDLDPLIDAIASQIFNSLPLIEGYIVMVEDESVMIDLGSIHHLRKGAKLVAFRPGKTIVHPVTGVVLGSKVTRLGEAVITQLQENLSTAIILFIDGNIQIGDKFVLK